MKKGGFLRNVLDTIRSNQASGQSGRGGSSGGTQERGIEFSGLLKPSHFSLAQVARHGFPEHPTALAFDPVQKIAAIGTKTGALRIFGRPGVDVWAQHEPAFAVTHIRFIVNQGAIITVTSDESIHLWSLRGPNLKLQLSTSNSQGATSASPQISSVSPAPTATSNLSSVSPQSGVSGATAQSGATAVSPSSLLGQITDTVSVAVDSASDFLSGGTSADHQLTPSPTGESGTKPITSRQPEILHTLKFQREHITYLHQTLASKWLYIGTERGNVHVVNVETFELSGYSIAWNKAIELSRKTHPGAIIHLSECPQDTNKLLIGYESGCIVLWDLKQRNADGRYYHTENLLWLAWHHEGKQFVAAHGDGSLITWLTRSNVRPTNILYPHAKTAPSAINEQQQQQQQLLASSVVRSLNNELYRPINKVDWKTLKNNEQFLLFSGGLPYDGFDQSAAGSAICQDSNTLNKPPSRQSLGLSPARLANTPAGQQQQQSQFLKAASASPGAAALSPSPMSPSISPGLQQVDPNRPSSAIGNQQHSGRQSNKKCLRSTSLTVMLGKSITVLEMDDTIIDFVTICDNSPYENDTSDPYAVIVLLSNELILIDLTSSGYPSFDSPYPSASLSESPVTCVQYLADCSSDLIPFLYSTSQNAVSRAPKKGFSDKEWPINGGEWGQSLQSYPELVITGHADGTIKFWDMSGINFDLISKIKTSKLFNRPSLPPNTTFISSTTKNAAQQTKRSSQNPLRPSSPLRSNTTPEHDHHQQQQQQSHFGSTPIETNAELTNQTAFIENLFAIEKIEFCSNTRHLLVAGACSQVIQFKLNKKESHSTSGGVNSGDLTTILVEPLVATNNKGVNIDQQQQIGNQHLIFRAKDHQNTTAGSSSGGSSSSSGSHRSRLSGFQAELVCLTPLLMNTNPPECDYTILCSTGTAQPISVEGPTSSSNNNNMAYYCAIPPKITALALQENHNILAYAHETGVVLVDLIQKCVIMNAALSDLYGGASALNNRDISVQPFATSSILQHHYQATNSSSSPGGNAPDFGYNSNNKLTNNITKGGRDQNDSLHTNENVANNGGGGAAVSAAAGASNPIVGASNGQTSGGSETTATAASSANNSSRQHHQPPILSRYTTNSMFQRQLSTNALNSSSSSANQNAPSSTNNRTGGGGTGSRLFQRQMTASQLFGGGGGSSAAISGGQQQQHDSMSSKQRAAALLAGARGAKEQPSSLSGATTPTSQGQLPGRPNYDSGGGGSSTNLSSIGGPPAAAAAAKKQPNKNKRIISRMLSISAIHTSVGSSSSAPSAAAAAAATGDFHGAAADHERDNTTTGNSDTLTGTNNDHHHHHHHHHHHQSTGPDKFDSSFTRSRSSSGSSTTAQNEQQGGGGSAAGQHLLSAGSSTSSSSSQLESIQCLAFLDPTTTSSFPVSGGANPAAAAIQQHQTGGGGGAQFQSSSGGSNHKSLSSIDNNHSQQQTGQLALWLGTSAGCVLLVSLTMPDNEDNRVLQLQSILAEPIPQASVKLAGQILCLTTFTCEARYGHSTGSFGGNQIGCSQSSSIESDSQHAASSLHSPSSLSSSNANNSQQTPTSSASSGGQSSATTGSGATTSTATTSGYGSSSPPASTGGGQLSTAGLNHCPSGHSSFDHSAQRSTGAFLAIVSEKQAHIYQVPANLAYQQQQQQQQQSAATKSDHHHSHHHTKTGSTSSNVDQTVGGGGGASLSSSSSHPVGSSCPSASSFGGAAAESPLAKLLVNKANLFARCELSDTSFACRSAVVQMRQPDESCLVSYLATGNIVVHSLPRLKPILMDADFVPYSSARIAQTMRLSRNGHCLYQPSSGEICKFTIGSQYKSMVNEMTGSLFVAREMPEMPRANFFKSLFSVSQSAKQSDRDELFGEYGAGRATRGVAKHIESGPGGSSSGLDKLKGAAVGTMGHDMRVAREGLDERGEKLSEIEDRTLNMLNQSESYAQAAHQLAQKFKDKKWYQF